jgi:hypothetical protein
MYPKYFGNNPLFPKKNDFEVVLKNKHAGKGVISYKSFNPGVIIAVMAGEIIHDIRQHSLQIDKHSHLHDIYFSGYFLHSCDPNISLDMQKLTVTAIKPIKPYDYLYMDYAETEEVLFKQFPCSCGSKQCRGWITGYRQSIDETDPLYQEYSQLRKIAV